MPGETPRDSIENDPDKFRPVEEMSSDELKKEKQELDPIMKRFTQLGPDAGFSDEDQRGLERYRALAKRQTELLRASREKSKGDKLKTSMTVMIEPAWPGEKAKTNEATADQLEQMAREVEDEAVKKIDPYKVLGLRKGATAEEIKRAYQDLSLKYLKEASGGGNQEKSRGKFRNVVRAYAILSGSRKAQDEGGQN